jgi:hypothetical protein
MSPDEWSKIRWFSSEEFDSKDLPGSGLSGMQAPFIFKLDELRGRWGKALSVNSGFRTAEHNARVGGKPNSAHLRGLAADLKTSGLTEAIRLAICAAQMGFKRIGVDKAGRYIHVDLDEALPMATWFYSEEIFA